MILAGHGKDPRLVQAELPIVPNVGDRIREDSNPKHGKWRLDSLVSEGEFIESAEKYGETFWKAKLKNGKFALMAPEDTVIVERAAAPVLVEEISLESLLEPFKENAVELPFDYDIPDIQKSDECYTPDYILDACRNFLGGFDLDPFSNAIAQRSVKADVFWSKADNALTKDWTSFKRKWCNPPYKKLKNDGIIDKIISYAHIGETLLLVNSSTSAKWFHKCMESCSAYLHPSTRIPFYNPYSELEYLAGKPRSSNEHSQTLFYFGDRPLQFAEALSSLGNAVQPIRKAVLAESNSVDNSLPEQDSFAVSISGEAILGISDNFKPIEIVEDPIVDQSYVKSFNVGDRIRFRDGYKTNLEYELTIGIITDIDDINIKVIWDGETDSDRYTKFHIAHKQWWEKVDPVSSIDAGKLPVSEDAIATEPGKSVANLRMDEGSVSVLVEIDKSVLVESSDRYQFLLERREQLINSGACPDGVWICCSEVTGKKFKQAVWKSSNQRPEWGGNKSQYIGKFMGDAHISAIAQHRAGQELRKVEREIKKLQVKS